MPAYVQRKEGGGVSLAEDDFGKVTRLLGEAQAGRPEALQEVVALVYPDLVSHASSQLHRYYGSRNPNPTLEPAALVSETYLKLIRQRSRYDSRGHFLAIASQLMLRVLIDYERARGRQKRGGDLFRVSLSEAVDVAVVEDASIEAFATALERLEALNTRAAEIVKARLIWGLTVPEIAESFGLSARTVERDIKFAQRWLEVDLSRQAE
jgi:RNA polymerase sigma factor (TIGR02999 family)